MVDGLPDELLRIPMFHGRVARGVQSDSLPLDVPLFFTEFVIFSIELNAFGVFAVIVMRGQVATSREYNI